MDTVRRVMDVCARYLVVVVVLMVFIRGHERSAFENASGDRDQGIHRDLL